MRSSSTQTNAAMIAAVQEIGAIVPAAAKMASSPDSVQQTVNEFKNSVS